MEPFEGVTLRFPVRYDLKVIMKSDKEVELNEAILRNILNGLTIPHSNWSHHHSREEKFVSFTVNVELAAPETMDALYSELRLEPSVRWAM